MRSSPIRMISMLLMLGCGGTWLAAQSVSGSATTDPQIPAARPWPATQDLSGTAETYPQIVRVSLVEGDVRVARGVEGRKSKGSGWEKAVADLPVESGFSLVTGVDGRAEIEFEDASTAYLAPNSVLAFKDLSSTGGAPHTELALLSGTMTLNVKPMVPAEWFSVRTPVNGFSVRYPDQAYMRVGSYLDGMTLTSLRATVFHVNGISSLPTAGGTTVTFHPGKAPAQTPEDKTQFAAWDHWVGQRVSDREQAMQATMQEAGLKSPIPGLAEMRGQGTFFDCAPYGTCWEPNAQASGSAAQPVLEKAEDPAVTATLARQTVSVSQLKQGGKQAGMGQVGPGIGQAGQTGPYGVTPYDFPCSPWWQQSLYRRDPLTGRLLQNPYPYSWAVCHTGSWIPRGRRYVWVVGIKRHHHHPYHWVQTGKTAGYVPIHPRDVAGKPPVNLKNGLLHPEKGGAVDRIAYNDGQKVKLLDEAPRAFRNEAPPALEQAEEPRALAFRLGDRTGPDAGGSKIALARPAGIAAGVPVTFDRKSQSFMVAQTVERGGVTRTVAEPIGGRGSSLQEHAGSGGAYSGGASASRASVSSGGGSSYSGGASHASAPSSSVSSAPAASSGGGASASAASSGGGKR